MYFCKLQSEEISYTVYIELEKLLIMICLRNVLYCVASYLAICSKGNFNPK